MSLSDNVLQHPMVRLV